jgi:hypothetical protein
MLGVYELNRVDLLKDVFLWAYDAPPRAAPPSARPRASRTRSGCGAGRR